MATLIAQGTDLTQHWTRQLPDSTVVRLGRNPRDGWSIPWDSHISREHADLEWRDNLLLVTQLESARNPLRLDGQPCSEIALRAGQVFKIGHTTFRLEDSAQVLESAPVYEQEYTSEAVKRLEFRNANHKLEILTKVPRILSVTVGSDRRLASSLVNILLEGVPAAEYVGIIQAGNPSDDSSESIIADQRVICWESRDLKTQISPSRRLIGTVHQRRASQIHVWSKDAVGDSTYTRSADLDWAFCVPIRGEAACGWVLYVCGTFASATGAAAIRTPQDLAGELKFAELLAEFVGEIRQARLLQQRHTRLSKFFSPSIMNTLNSMGRDSGEVLEPRESDITVMFCDLRGFSRHSEQQQHNLLALLDRVSDALLVMTNNILKHDGAIADFQGDAALAFWGWPTEQSDAPVLACRAAIEILSEFQEAEVGESLAEFQVGIGIAHGIAIAGRIGTDLQEKIGVFGPVVNLGARLESMTKQLGASILLDESTAAAVERNVMWSDGRLMHRGCVLPVGLDQPLQVTELIPSIKYAPEIQDVDVNHYEAAVTAVSQGAWDQAAELLNRLPVRFRGRKFLTQCIADHRTSMDWDGVIRLKRK